MVVLVRGGSTGAGIGVNKSYVDLLASFFLPFGIEVINRSRMSDTSFEGLDTFSHDISPFRPDVLIINFGLDDLFRPVYRSEFKENLVQIVRRSRAEFAPFVMLTTFHPLRDSIMADSDYVFFRTIREVSVDLSCHYVPIHLFWSAYIEEHKCMPQELLVGGSYLPCESGQFVYFECMKKSLSRFI